jgi:hypothetical protein
MALQGCNVREEQANAENNPAEEGFDFANSDPAAIELADSIMVAMGGRRAWDNTKFISWSFFDLRDYTWDKEKNRIRVETRPDGNIYLLNLNSNEGRVRIAGREISDKDSLEHFLQQAREWWINDSYWLFMPFRLKDKGVNLKYLGEDNIQDSVKCNVLQIMFQQDNPTAQVKYLAYVDLKDNLIKQWSFFSNVKSDTATSTRPFDNYQKHGAIRLSADRSDSKGPRNVKVLEDLPNTLFTKF